MSDKKLPDSIDQALSNLSKKPTEIIGGMISDLLAIPASHIRQYAFLKAYPNSVSYNVFKDDIINKVSVIEEDKIRIPEQQVFCQAIEDSTYCLQHKELRSMFSSLLANACNLDYSEFMHPSFSNTLKCLSPYDAVLFQRLASDAECSEKAVNAAEYLVLSKGSPNYLLVHKCIIYTDEYFKNLEMQSISVSALLHLGLIECTNSESFSVDKKYENIDFLKDLERKYAGTDCYPVVRHKQVFLTPYGVALAKACSVCQINNE